MSSPSPEKHQRAQLWIGIIGIVIAIVAALITYKAYIEPRAPVEGSSREQREPYIAQVDELCRAAGGDLRRLGPPPLADLRLYAQHTHQARIIFDRLGMSWDKIDYPEQDRARLLGILSDLRTMVGNMDETVNAAQAGATELLHEQITVTREVMANIRKATTTFGFRSCPGLFDAVGPAESNEKGTGGRPEWPCRIIRPAALRKECASGAGSRPASPTRRRRAWSAGAAAWRPAGR
jgi:hypothetical protein